MAKKKAAVKKVAEKGLGKKKAPKKPRKFIRRDLVDQNSTGYVVFEDAQKTGGQLFTPVVIMTKAIAQSCHNEVVKIEDFEFSVTYNGVGPYIQTIIPGTSDTECFIEATFRPWVDDLNTFYQEELVVTVKTKKNVRIR